jgi:hypothetical protein
MRCRIVRLILFILIISVSFQSCQKSSVIDEKKFIKIYAEMLFMQDTSMLSQQTIKESVLKKFNVSENDYDHTITFYNDDPERWPKFFDSTIVYIEKLNPKIKKPDVKSLPKRSVSLEKKNL